MDEGLKLVSAGKIPVVSYQLARFAGSCSQVRNCAAAFLLGDQEVMKADEDCVVL